MTLLDTFSYFFTVFIIAVAPGPVVLLLMARAAARDTSGALACALGYAIGGLIIISAVCFGLSAWLTSVPEFFVYSKYIMLAYLSWMAYSMWTKAIDLDGSSTTVRGSFWAAMGAGLTACMISPYMMILFPLVLPEILDISVIAMPDFLIASASTFSAILVGGVLVVLCAAQIQRFVRTPKGAMRLNRTLALLLVAGGGGMALA